MVHQATVEYFGPGNQPKLSVIHFTDAATPAVMQATMNRIKTGLKPFMSNQYSVGYRATFRTLDTATGQLIAETAFPVSPQSEAGLIAGQPVADATSFLWKWRTGQVVGSRYLQGRTFVPGLAVSQMANGNLAPTVIGQMATEITAVITQGAGTLAVWSRQAGVALPVSSGSAWAELATQRRRRG